MGVAQLDHVRARLHELAADDRTILGRAQLNTEEQASALEMTFQLLGLVGP